MGKIKRVMGTSTMAEVQGAWLIGGTQVKEKEDGITIIAAKPQREEKQRENRKSVSA